MQYQAGNSFLFLTIICMSLITAFLTDFLVVRHYLKNRTDTNPGIVRDADGNRRLKEKHWYGLGIISGLVVFIVLMPSYVPPIVAVLFASASFLGGWIASKSVSRTIEWKLEYDESLSE